MKENNGTHKFMNNSASRFNIGSLLRKLRTENLKHKDSYIILYLLSLEKDNILSVIEPLSKSSSYVNQDAEERKKLQFSSKYDAIHECFIPVLNSVTETGLLELIHFVKKIYSTTAPSDFQNLFEEILIEINYYVGRFGGNEAQPNELAWFMISLSNTTEESKIFNPFAGHASFSVYLDKYYSYFGQELNRFTWAIGKLRVLANNKPNKIDLNAEDSITNWPHHSEEFDLIISNPPQGFREDEKYREIIPGFKSIELFYIEKGLESLSANGKLIALLPDSFLFRGGSEKTLRKTLLDNNLIDVIISLPAGLLPNTSFSTCIAIINRNKKWPEIVKLIDGKKYLSRLKTQENSPDYKSLLEHIDNTQADSEYIRNVNKKDIERNEYNLSVPRYFIEKVEGVKLKSILTFLNSERGDNPRYGKVIRYRDLKNDQIDNSIDSASLEISELKNMDVRLPSESCLLLALRGENLKPTFYDFNGETLFTSTDILPCKIYASDIDIDYLINELKSKYVNDQINCYKIGSMLPFIRKEDLLDVVIKIPPINEQRAKIQGIQELTQKIISLEKERNALALGHTIEQFNEFASLKHTLGRPRQNILDWSDNILDFFNQKKEAFEELNSAFAQFYEKDILSALMEIKRDVNFMTEVLEKGESGLTLEKFKKSVLSLASINELIDNLSNNGFNFTISKMLVAGEYLEEKGIEINSTLFKTLLDNILTNANKYAFDDKEAGNEVVIELTEVDEYLSMEIRNNGKPFPNHFDRDKFITKYATADMNNGSGLGGYDIHRIACDFNNPDWILSLNEDPLYPVKFKFQFPIKPIS